LRAKVARDTLDKSEFVNKYRDLQNQRRNTAFQTLWYSSCIAYSTFRGRENLIIPRTYKSKNFSVLRKKDLTSPPLVVN